MGNQLLNSDGSVATEGRRIHPDFPLVISEKPIRELCSSLRLLHHQACDRAAYVLEALKIAAGSRVVLGIAGFQHPVVHMSHTEPPEDFEPVMLCRRAFDDSRQAIARIDAIFPMPSASGFHVWATCPIGNETFEAAAVVAMAKARELAEEIQTGKKQIP